MKKEWSYRTLDSGGTSRRGFIKLLLGLGGVAAGFIAYRLLFSSGGGSTSGGSGGGDYFDVLNSNIVSGGPPKDGIPSIDRPNFISTTHADQFLRPDDVVFGIVYQGEARAYPQRILVWHEIVNDSFQGESISITYCPLTGSQVAFKGRSLDGEVLTFGTTGNLVNSNLLMYDRLTDSNWPQILGTAINGSMRGHHLEEVPLVWTTWERWKALHPGTWVLSTDTGYVRDYGYDPYGSYVPTLGGYYRDDGLIFPVINESNRFPRKKVFMGLRHQGERAAVPLQEFSSTVIRNVSVGGSPLVLLYDERLDTIRAFKRQVEDRTLTFDQVDGAFVDVETGSRWSPEGLGLEGTYEGVSLQQVNVFNVMWFAWYAFYPDTKVIQ